MMRWGMPSSQKALLGPPAGADKLRAKRKRSISARCCGLEPDGGITNIRNTSRAPTARQSRWRSAHQRRSRLLGRSPWVKSIFFDFFDFLSSCRMTYRENGPKWR
jgi:hypothetical protein